MIMRIWFISDTHRKHGFLEVPENIDMVICAGDVGAVQLPAVNANEVLDFIEWYESLDIPTKVWIAGNHDTSIAAGLVRPENKNGCIFLDHAYVEVDGLKIFGSPYTPEFGVGWAYNVPRGKLHNYWDDIPKDLDILITHGPPLGVGDFAESGYGAGDEIRGLRVGCKELMQAIGKKKPAFHVFGHIHENAGEITKLVNMDTTFINACVVNLDYQKVNNGIVVDYDI